MHHVFLMLIFIPLFAIVLAVTYTSARHYAARRRCYKRASLGSLVRGAKRNAIIRHLGRA